MVCASLNLPSLYSECILSLDLLLLLLSGQINQRIATQDVFHSNSFLLRLLLSLLKWKSNKCTEHKSEFLGKQKKKSTL